MASTRSVSVLAGDLAVAASLCGLVSPAPKRAFLVDDAAEHATDPVPLPCGEVVCLDGVACATEAAIIGPTVRKLLGSDDVLVLDSTQWSRDLAGWLAAVAGAAVVWATTCVRLLGDDTVEAERPMLGGSHRMVQEVEGSGLVVVLAKPTVRPGEGRAAGAPVRRLAPALAPGAVRVLGHAGERPQGSGLGSARVVVAVGRGIGGPEHIEVFRRLADRLGAELGASRAVVDAGWLPFAHQIGQTGTAVAPDVYLAFGISGAIQHLVGMRAAKRIVAVNTEPSAPLCRLADVVVVGDAVTVAEQLLQRLDAAG